MRVKSLHFFTVSLCTIALLLSMFAFAQDTTQQTAPPQNQATGPRHMRMHANRMQHLARYLNLTDAQKAQIKPILQNEGQQLKALRNDTSLTPDQRKVKVQEIRQATRAQIQPILTPEQVAKFQDLRGKMASRGMGGPNQLAWMSKKLNLTDDQKSKLEPIFADQHKQVQAIRQNTTLTNEQKQSEINQLRQSTHQQVLSILTPEQQQQMKQMRGMRMHRNGPPPAETAPSSAPQAPSGV